VERMPFLRLFRTNGAPVTRLSISICPRSTVALFTHVGRNGCRHANPLHTTFTTFRYQGHWPMQINLILEENRHRKKFSIASMLQPGAARAAQRKKQQQLENQTRETFRFCQNSSVHQTLPPQLSSVCTPTQKHDIRVEREFEFTMADSDLETKSEVFRLI
jgi:hypothetical protein